MIIYFTMCLLMMCIHSNEWLFMSIYTNGWLFLITYDYTFLLYA